MATFFHRFVGALVLDASVFEDIEADRRSALQSAVVVLLACVAGGIATIGLDMSGLEGFAAGAIIVLGAWVVWVTMIAALGTMTFPEARTSSNVAELLRTVGFAAAPGVFLVFGAMRAVAPFVLTLVSLWMIAAAVVGARQALDYRSTPRAIAVCGLAWVMSIDVMAVIFVILTRSLR